MSVKLDAIHPAFLGKHIVWKVFKVRGFTYYLLWALQKNLRKMVLQY